MWRDPYLVAKEKLVSDVEGLLNGKYDVRPIEVIPAVLINEALDLDTIARMAVKGKVQNKLLYLCEVTNTLPIDANLKTRLESIIDYLRHRRDSKEQWFGEEDFDRPEQVAIYRRICRDAQTPLMQNCRVFGKYTEDTFRRQFELYQDGPAAI